MLPEHPDRLSGVTKKALDLFFEEHILLLAEIAPDLTVQSVSGNGREILRDDSLIEGKPLLEIFWEFVGAEQDLAQVLSGEKPVHLLEGINHERADGTFQYLNFRVMLMDSNKPGSGLLLMVEDVTQDRLLEQQLVQDRNELRLAQSKLKRINVELERLNSLKTLFLSIAAHDLRAPLAAIRGYADLMLSDLQSQADTHWAEHIEFLNSINAQVVRLDRLISDFLDLDLIEKNRLIVSIKPCNLTPLLDEAAKSFFPLALRHEIGLDLASSPADIWVQADPERVRQILDNLISNAIKYTQAGGSIEISSGEELGQGFFQVKDNGQGIPENEIIHLFELYYRTEETQHRQVRGTGLGLFIAKWLVDAQHGQITVDSRIGYGTTFTIYLPSI